MNWGSLRALYALAVPGGILLLAAVEFLRWAATETVAALAHVYPVAVLAAGLLLGWRFNRSGVVFALLVLAAADRALFYFAAGGAGASGAGRIVFSTVSLLLPLNLVGFCVMGRRGPWLPRFAGSLGALGAQVLLVWLLHLLGPEKAAMVLDQGLVQEWLVAWTPLPQPGLLAFGLAFILLLMRSASRQRAVDNGFFWALVAAFLALHRGGGGAATTIYLSTAGLILGVSVIEASYRLAYRDELTGLPTRRALSEALLQLQKDYAVAMVDVDHFKKFNDTYGHEVGDQVLRMVGAKLARVSGGGRAFRYGGEEFAVLFAGKVAEEALPHLEAVRETIESSRFGLRGADRRRRKSSGSRKAVTVTVSIGVAEPQRRTASPAEVIAAADEALYRAKRAGRNQVKMM